MKEYRINMGGRASEKMQRNILEDKNVTCH